MGYGLRLILLFNSRKSEINQTVLSFLGMTNVGAAHSDRLTRLSTPILHNQSTSSFMVLSMLFGMLYALA